MVAWDLFASSFDIERVLKWNALFMKSGSWDARGDIVCPCRCRNSLKDQGLESCLLDFLIHQAITAQLDICSLEIG